MKISRAEFIVNYFQKRIIVVNEIRIISRYIDIVFNIIRYLLMLEVYFYFKDFQYLKCIVNTPKRIYASTQALLLNSIIFKSYRHRATDVRWLLNESGVST